MHYGYALEVVAVLGRPHFRHGIAGRCIAHCMGRRKDFPNQAVYRSFAVLGAGVGS